MFDENTWPHLVGLKEGQPLLILERVGVVFRTRLSAVSQLNENDGSVWLCRATEDPVVGLNTDLESVFSAGFIDGWTIIPAVMLETQPEKLPAEEDLREAKVWVQITEGWFVPAVFERKVDRGIRVRFFLSNDESVFSRIVVSEANVYVRNVG